MIKLGKKIQEARKRKRITQEELAKAVGISDKSVSAYEANRINPSLRVLERIAVKTQSPLSYFFEENLEGDILAKLKQLEEEFDDIKRLLKK